MWCACEVRDPEVSMVSTFIPSFKCDVSSVRLFEAIKRLIHLWIKLSKISDAQGSENSEGSTKTQNSRDYLGYP